MIDEHLNRIFTILRNATRVDFSYYKQPTIRRRLQRRMVLHKINNIEQYIKFLQENPNEVQSLYADILIHVTRFFREPESFDTLAEIVFPAMMAARHEGPHREGPIRIWTPGCATGEESYSVAIALMEFLGERRGAVPDVPAEALGPGEALLWRRQAGRPQRVRIVPGRSERRRHTRKYAEGELPPDRSFYFRGPEKKLNLRANNLKMFAQLAEGVDDATWLHHLRRGDYSRWFREGIKDEELAREDEGIEQDESLSPQESRERIHDAMDKRYTLPAGGSEAH